jgi:hypothetical protein
LKTKSSVLEVSRLSVRDLQKAGVPISNQRWERLFSFLQEFTIRKTKRSSGFICHVAASRSGRFWCVIKGDSGVVYFGYGKNFLNCDEAKIGMNCEFTALPPSHNGPLCRATEIKILPPSKRKRDDGETIIVLRLPGVVRIVARGRSGDVALGELRLDDAPFPEDLYLAA